MIGCGYSGPTPTGLCTLCYRRNNLRSFIYSQMSTMRGNFVKNALVEHTLARECHRATMKVYGEGEIWPTPAKKTSTDGHQNVHRWLRRRYQPSRNILSKSVQGFRICVTAHAWFRAPRHIVTRLFFAVLEKGYSRDARTDVDAKYVKRRGSVQESAFWESRNQYLRLGPPFSPKNRLHHWAAEVA